MRLVYSLLLTSIFASGVSAVSQTYTIKDLGTLGGSFSQANAILILAALSDIRPFLRVTGFRNKR